jgi:hypothetical protein
MRWILLFLGSVATGVLTIVFSLALLLVSVYIHGKYVLGIPSNGVVAWDPSRCSVESERSVFHYCFLGLDAA